eukprot:6135573-Pleurochrysis_carterae.AAC.1
MPHYGLMCRSLRDAAFFATYASRRARGSVDEYVGFPNALVVTRALNAIQDAAERHLDVHVADAVPTSRRRTTRGMHALEDARDVASDGEEEGIVVVSFASCAPSWLNYKQRWGWALLRLLVPRPCLGHLDRLRALTHLWRHGRVSAEARLAAIQAAMDHKHTTDLNFQQ